MQNNLNGNIPISEALKLVENHINERNGKKIYGGDSSYRIARAPEDQRQVIAKEEKRLEVLSFLCKVLQERLENKGKYSVLPSSNRPGIFYLFLPRDNPCGEQVEVGSLTFIVNRKRPRGSKSGGQTEMLRTREPALA